MIEAFKSDGKSDEEHAMIQEIARLAATLIAGNPETTIQDAVSKAMQILEASQWAFDYRNSSQAYKEGPGVGAYIWAEQQQNKKGTRDYEAKMPRIEWEVEREDEDGFKIYKNAKLDAVTDSFFPRRTRPRKNARFKAFLADHYTLSLSDAGKKISQLRTLGVTREEFDKWSLFIPAWLAKQESEAKSYAGKKGGRPKKSKK